MLKPILTIENLSFGYQDFLVLDDVNLNVYSGEFIGIIGPNGGGKTTLLKLIMGFLKPLSGNIELFGKRPEEVSTLISYVPQAMRFDRQFPISVMELVLMGRLSHLPWYGIYSQADRKAAREAMEKVGVAHLAQRSFGTLSGGQAQRVMIARALASNPELLLLDEPTANVDAQAQGEIYELLKGLKGQMTILMVTHDLGVAIEHVDRVFCVQNQVFALKPQDVCEHFAFGLYHPPLKPRKKT